MYHVVKNHRLLILLLLISLTCFIALTAQFPSTAAARTPGGSAMRLRLKVQSNTLSSGATTKIFAEFLDRDYQQVANDGTRVIEFGLGSAGSRQGSGDISPQRVTVPPGAWSAEATFSSRQQGKVLITARADGLDPAQTLLVVTPPGSSFLFGLFETVAYADGPEGFEIWPRKLVATANGNSQAIFQVSFLKPPPANTIIRISVEPPAAIIYNGETRGARADIKLGEGKYASEDIGIKSSTAATVDILAAVLPNGPRDRVLANFHAPRPSRIVFGDELRDISSTESNVPLLIQLADDGGSPTQPDQEELITFRSANGENFVKFDPPFVALSSNRRSAQTMLQLSGLPMGNELKVLAVSQGQRSLTPGQKSIVIRSPIEKVMITGPKEVTRGNNKAEFTVHLADKDGKHMVADWDRRINLSVTSGSVSPTQVMIRKGEDQARVQYTSSTSLGEVLLKAGSGGLPDASLGLLVVTAPFWLVLAALFGGLVGGVVQQIHKDYKLKRIMPKWNGECWELGLVGRVGGSVVSGLFLYWTMKFGLARMIGSPALPAAFDLGTTTAAFFFGGIGGFAGTVVFDRLVSWCLPAPKKEAEIAAAGTGHPNPTQA